MSKLQQSKQISINPAAAYISKLIGPDFTQHARPGKNSGNPCHEARLPTIAKCIPRSTFQMSQSQPVNPRNIQNLSLYTSISSPSLLRRMTSPGDIELFKNLVYAKIFSLGTKITYKGNCMHGQTNIESGILCFKI